MNSIIQDIISQTNLSAQEAWWLLEHITGAPKEALMLSRQTLTSDQLANLTECINQLRDQAMPLAYILGYVPFLDLKITVQPPILIPRQETEEWVHNLITLLKNNDYGQEIKTILDIGTGSGCIALALAHHFPQAHITAIDINPQALDLARNNAQINHIENISFILSDLFSNIPHGQAFNLIVSNPPYINPAAYDQMSNQVKNWEDHNALFAENDGTKIIAKIIDQAATFLKASTSLPCQLVIEIDQYHKDQIMLLAKQATWTSIQPQKDFFGNWRTIWLK